MDWVDAVFADDDEDDKPVEKISGQKRLAGEIVKDTCVKNLLNLQNGHYKIPSIVVMNQRYTFRHSLQRLGYTKTEKAPGKNIYTFHVPSIVIEDKGESAEDVKMCLVATAGREFNDKNNVAYRNGVVLVDQNIIWEPGNDPLRSSTSAPIIFSTTLGMGHGCKNVCHFAIRDRLDNLIQVSAGFVLCSIADKTVQITSVFPTIPANEIDKTGLIVDVVTWLHKLPEYKLAMANCALRELIKDKS